MSRPISKRPRDVGISQSAAILYGDWGTSKAYVIGLAFAIAGYHSFWLIAAVCVLMAVVALNYVTICKYSPTGGGVYASARKKSQTLALVGAFFLVADYLITAALSALSCFDYLGVQDPAIWAFLSILFIGLLNYFGPRHTGNIASVLALSTFAVVILLGLISIPFITPAIKALKPLSGGFWDNWGKFVGIIVALSGIESIANTTGVMKLDPGSTDDSPSVHQTSKKAIIMVMFEVCFFTAFFGLVINAIPNLTLHNGQVDAPNQPEIRDAMLKYMGEYFVSSYWGSEALGVLFGHLISIAFALLLLSAVNTAILALISLLFVMSRDGEMPAIFQKLTPYGVPKVPLIMASVLPAIVLIFVHDLASLAELYAVGFVGAIATNLGVNAYDITIPMSKKERWFMWTIFVVMAAIEITLFIDKPGARRFAISILSIGLILRALVIEHRQKQWAVKKVKLKHSSLYTDDARIPLHEGSYLVAVRSIGKTLDFALQEAKKSNQTLYILFVREQKVITEEDKNRTWLDDDAACQIFDYAKDSSHEILMKFFYTISDSPAHSIVNFAKVLKVSRLILGRPRHSAMLQLIRGSIVQEVSDILPSEIDYVVIS